MAKQKKAAKKASDFPNGSKQNMDYSKHTTQNAVSQQYEHIIEKDDVDFAAALARGMFINGIAVEVLTSSGKWQRFIKGINRIIWQKPFAIRYPSIDKAKAEKFFQENGLKLADLKSVEELF